MSIRDQTYGDAVLRKRCQLLVVQLTELQVLRMQLQAAEARTLGRTQLAAKCDRRPARNNGCLTASAWAHPSQDRKLDDLCASEIRNAHARSTPAGDVYRQQGKENSE